MLQHALVLGFDIGANRRGGVLIGLRNSLHDLSLCQSADAPKGI